MHSALPRRWGVPIAVLIAGVSLVSPFPAQAQWTQWGGPNGDFSIEVTGLADNWPDDGPPRVWHRALGDGYSSIIVEGGILYTMYRKSPTDTQEYTIALDSGTGKTLWEHGRPAPLTQDKMYTTGPNSTPACMGDHVYSIGTALLLQCFEKESGRVVWKRDLADEFGKPLYSYGYACSPLTYQGKIILAFGGRDSGSTTLMALDGKTGHQVWKNEDIPRKANKRCEYSSPILINFSGKDQIVYATNEQLAGFNPITGELLWHHPLVIQEGRNISTPVWNGKDLLFYASAYDSGARVIHMTRRDGLTVPEELWFNRHLKLHHGNAILVGDCAYGSHGDFGAAFFEAMELNTGNILWRHRGLKKATCLYADGKLIILDEDGQLVLASGTRDGLSIISEYQVTEHQSWTPPTLVGKTLYVRDRKNIMALDLG